MKLKTINEWIDVMGNHWAALEQVQYQSVKYKICVECLSKKDLILKDKRALIKSTDYYLCKKCDDYYNKKLGL